MIIYIAGPITGHLDYRKKFKAAEEKLKEMGHTPINPAYLPDGLGNRDDYLHICYSMIDKADGVYLLDNWLTSIGAIKETEYARKKGKMVFHEKETEDDLDGCNS